MDFGFQPPSRLEAIAQHADKQDADRNHLAIMFGNTDRGSGRAVSCALAVAGVALYEAGRTIIGKDTQLAAHLLEVSGRTFCRRGAPG